MRPRFLDGIFLFSDKDKKVKAKATAKFKLNVALENATHTVFDVCSTDWPKKDSADFESQNFEGP